MAIRQLPIYLGSRTAVGVVSRACEVDPWPEPGLRRFHRPPPPDDSPRRRLPRCPRYRVCGAAGQQPARRSDGKHAAGPAARSRARAPFGAAAGGHHDTGVRRRIDYLPRDGRTVGGDSDARPEPSAHDDPGHASDERTGYPRNAGNSDRQSDRRSDRQSDEQSDEQPDGQSDCDSDRDADSDPDRDADRDVDLDTGAREADHSPRSY